MLTSKNRSYVYKSGKNKQSYYILLFIVWTIFAVYRYVGQYKGIIVGGSDTPTYIEYFNTCLQTNVTSLYSYRTEILFRVFTMAIRYFTNDYHVYFFIIYGFIIYCYISFIDEFDTPQINKTPLIMLFFCYLQSFCAIRTHITIAITLLILVCLHRKKYFYFPILAIMSFFIQKASLIFLLYPFFLFYFSKKKLTWKKAVSLVVFGCCVGVLGRRIILSGTIDGLSGVYVNYALKSTNSGYFIDYIKLIIEQVIIDILVVTLLRKHRNYKLIASENSKDESIDRIQNLTMMCYYDLMLIPVCYVMGIWRGYCYFYIPRLLMLGYMLAILYHKINSNSKKLYKLLIFCICVSWFIFRLTTIYDVSDLMPYIFDFQGWRM